VKRWTKREVKIQVLQNVISYLGKESQCDVDDQAFIEMAVVEQERLARKLQRDLNKLM